MMIVLLILILIAVAIGDLFLCAICVNAIDVKTKTAKPTRTLTEEEKKAEKAYLSDMKGLLEYDGDEDVER